MKAVTKRESQYRESQYLEAFSQCRTIYGAAKICGVCAPVATRALRHIAKKLGKSKPSELLEHRYGEDSFTESQKEKLRMFRKYRSVGATAIAMRLSHGAVLSSLMRSIKQKEVCRTKTLFECVNASLNGTDSYGLPPLGMFEPSFFAKTVSCHTVD